MDVEVEEKRTRAKIEHVCFRWVCRVFDQLWESETVGL